MKIITTVVKARPRSLQGRWVIDMSEDFYMYGHHLTDGSMREHADHYSITLYSREIKAFIKQELGQCFTVINLPKDNPLLSSLLLKFKLRTLK